MTEAFDPELELARFRNYQKNTGAIVSFTGIVRSDADTLILSHYPGFTDDEVKRVGEQALERWGLKDYMIIHRVGEMQAGDVIVLVAAASRHRRDAFEATDYIMDKLKSDVPFWKQEKRDGAVKWIEPRAQDKDDLKRWET